MDKTRVEEKKKANLLDKAHDIREGLLFNLRTSRGFQWHLAADVLFITLGLCLRVGENYIFWLFLAAGVKISAECFNTSHERHTDKIHGTLDEAGYNHEAATDKHSSSAGVGVWVILSLALWAWIFAPYLFERLWR